MTAPITAAMTGRIDVHSHLLPCVDDGCESLDESIACARRLVEAGYTHSFCTPHVLVGLPTLTNADIAKRTADLQEHFRLADIPLTLLPGGEINVAKNLSDALPEPRIATYGGFGRYCLVDIWADKLPDFFDAQIRWLQGKNLKVILAHPERMKAVQLNPDLADHFASLGLVLQGNLQCFSDPRTNPTRQIAEKFLIEGRYFLLGSDLHKLATLDARLTGLRHATDLVGQTEIDRLTIEHPRLLLG